MSSLTILDFRRPSPQTFDEYASYVDYNTFQQNQHQRNEFDHDRRPSPFHTTTAPVPSRPHIPPPVNEYSQTHVYNRDLPRQPVMPPPIRVNPLHPNHAAPVAHHPMIVRDQFYRPQFQPQQFPEYANGYQAPFNQAQFVGHPAVQQHMNPNMRRHDDNLRNLRSPLLEEFRSAKNKKFELQVLLTGKFSDFARIFSVTLSNLVVTNTGLASFNRNLKLRLLRKSKLSLTKLHHIPSN